MNKTRPVANEKPSSNSVSAEHAREFLRQSSELGKWSTAYAEKILGLGPRQTREALQALETSGYVKHSGRDNWENTAEGTAAVHASHARPIKRDTAEERLNELVERARQINNDDEFLFFVQRIVVFGPYLVRSAAIRDVDVAVELTPKNRDESRQVELMKKLADAAAESGKKFKNHAARENYARTEVLDFLRGRGRTLAIQETEPWILQQPHKVIFAR